MAKSNSTCITYLVCVLVGVYVLTIYKIRSVTQEQYHTCVTPLSPYINPPKIQVNPNNGEKLRILFLTHAYNYESGMDRHAFIHYKGLLYVASLHFKHPHKQQSKFTTENTLG